MIELLIEVYIAGVLLLWLLSLVICVCAGSVSMGKVRHRKNGNEKILASDHVVGEDVNNACELLIGVLLPLLQDAHHSNDIAVAAFCSRLVTDLGALQGMVTAMIKEDKMASDNVYVSEDIELGKWFDGLMRVQ